MKGLRRRIEELEAERLSENEHRPFVWPYCLDGLRLIAD